MTRQISREVTQKSADEMKVKEEMLRFLLENISDFGQAWEYHLSLFVTRQALSRQLYYDRLYQCIIDVPGVICEFGVQWGASLAILANLRGIYEPYNYSRRIVGFDTFEGFAHVSEEDGDACQVGDYAVTHGYEEKLKRILMLHEASSPLAHIKKLDIVKGDARETTAQWMRDNPHAVIAMAVFDMDVYGATRDVLWMIMPRLTRGSVLVFDELSCPQFPGETMALAEVIGLKELRLRRTPLQPYCAWAVWGD